MHTDEASLSDISPAKHDDTRYSLTISTLNLLAEPASRNDAVEALCLAFSDAQPEAVEHDVAHLFAAPVAADLIEIAS